MNRRGIVFTLIVICCLLRSSSSDAANNNWTNSSGGLWETGANWSQGSIPDSPDTAQLGINGSYTVTLGSSAVNADPTTLTNAGLNVYNFNNVNNGTPTLTINFTNAATLTVNGSMNMGNAIVNLNTPNGGLSLGAYPSGLTMGNSSYGLTNTLNIQSGTFNAGGFSVLGSSVGSSSTINVSTGGTFTIGYGRIGNNGTSQINVNGGTLVVGSVTTGYGLGTTGRIVMTSGSINVTSGNAWGLGGGDRDSANQGYGELIISNGSFYNAGFYSVLNVGDGMNTLGGGGRGYMKVYGGNHTNFAYVHVGGGFNANGNNSTGVVLLAGGTWNAGAKWFLGNGTNAYAFVTVTNGTYQGIANGGGITIGSGYNSVSELDLDAGGRIILTTGTGAASDPALEVGNVTNSVAKVHVSGGTMVVRNGGGGILIGTNTSGNASFVMDGGLVQLTRLNVGPSGVFSNRTGGVLQFVASDTVSGTGNKVVDGGTLSYKNYAALTVSVAAAKFNIVSGSGLELDSSTNANIAGTYALSDSAGNFKDLSLTGTGTLWRSDALQVSAGTRLHFSNVINARVNSALTNLGTVLVENSTVSYLNPVTISGRYISDPSTNTYSSNVTVAASGTLEGGIGDRFDFKKNLFINSTNKTQFDLSLSEVRFSGGGNHTNAVTGGDFGTNNFPMQNFSYGRLSLASSTDHVYFASGGFSNGAASNALYVTDLDLLGNTNLVANLHSSFNIYYMISVNDPFNAYLNDRTYGLQGGGFLIPAIPEPSALAMLLAVGMLFGWGKRNR